jgi:energy-coupling factor transporter ATP-binding protein EcfA2
MLRRVSTLWIEGMLQSSLQDVPLLHLGLQTYPAALENPWERDVQETHIPISSLPAGTTLLQAYEQAEGSLLLLGEPGAGKTTLLLALVRILLLQAEQDERYRLPAVFHLSSWSVKQSSISEWLVEELHSKYRIPRPIGQAWVDREQLTLFLDGLDEVTEAARPACIKAIQSYHLEHRSVPLLVSSRREAYFALETRVSLQKAVLVQPLTKAQIEQYFHMDEDAYGAVRAALHDDPALAEMVQTPLIMVVPFVKTIFGQSLDRTQPFKTLVVTCSDTPVLVFGSQALDVSARGYKTRSKHANYSLHL